MVNGMFNISLSLMLLVSSTMVFAYDLQHNPFRQPVNLSGSQNPHHTESLAMPRNGEELELRAIVADGADSLVDVNGRILRIGDTIDGYILLSVDEKAAIFKAGKDRVTILLDKDDKDISP